MKPFTTADFQEAKAKHLQFKSRLRAILYDELTGYESTTVLSQYACGVGQWLYGYALIVYEDIPQVHELEQVHASIHIVARDLVKRYQQGYVEEARQGLVGMEQIADRLVELLHIVEKKVATVESGKVTAKADNQNTILTALLAKNELLDAKIKQQVERAQKNRVARYNEQQVLQESQQQLLTLFDQSPVGIAIIGVDNLTFLLANSFYGHLVGRTPQQLIGKPLLDALPELAGQGFDVLLRDVIATGVPFMANEMAVELIRHGQLETIYVDLTYQPRQENNGFVSGILVVATDVTQQVITRRTVEQSEARFRSLIEKTPIAIALFRGNELIIELANEVMIGYWQKGPAVVGKPYREAVPELVGQGYFEKLEEIFQTGQEYHDLGARADLVENGVISTHYFNYSYTPLFDLEGKVYAVLNMGNDVTQQIIARQQEEEQEARFRALVEEAPVATMLLTGPNHLIELANQSMIDMLGKGPSLLGKPAVEAVPELATQTYLNLLDHVFASGETYQSKAMPGQLVNKGVATNHYFDFTYKPMRNRAGEVYGIMSMAVDVTESVKDRQKLQEAEATLRGAIELADIGTWEIDITAGLITYSERLKQFFESTQDSLTVDSIMDSIKDTVYEPDQVRIQVAMSLAANPDSGGLLDEEYTIVTRQTKRHRIVRAQARVFFDPDGQPTKMVGTMRDVTEERKQQLALEQLVQERTEQLASANNELAAANKELIESNQLLTRSNENLQKFAYVASHDLQEPLRKIQQFGDLLKNRVESPSAEASLYIERMLSGANRMSDLIRDLLSFSRISTRRNLDAVVSLDQVVDQIQSDLELLITETKAIITISDLPIIRGDASQLGQLFQNLLSNALKFRRMDHLGVPISPSVQISSQLVASINLPPSVKPTQFALSYYRIDVTDNGIGFDEKYLDRIFQVFQRLHGRNEFSGTGIGLAICEKVAANHGGAITATSHPGQGTTFHVYLPDF